MATTRASKPAAKKTATKKTAASKAGKVAKKAASGTIASKQPGLKKVPAGKALARRTATSRSANSTSKTVAKKAVAKTPRKPAANKTKAVPKSAARRTATVVVKTGAKPQLRKAAGRQTPAKPVFAGKTAAASKAPVPKSAAAGARKPRKITPQQALANTRALLEAKQQHDRQPQPWQTLDPEQSHLPSEGFQSPEAAAKAEELHAGESRMQAIQGSIGSQDRHNQGKRDKR